MELELKLLVEPEARPLIEGHSALKAVKPRRDPAITTYYDTADLALYRMGASLRVRQSGKDFVQTVKMDRPGADIGARGEWEWVLTSATPEAGRLADLPDRAAEIEAVARRSEPLFVTEIERTSWPIEIDGTTIEAVFDEGLIRAGAATLGVSEVELELKGGSAIQLYRLAIGLSERAPLRFGAQSKAERGYALLGKDLPARPSHALPDWDRTVTIGTAFPRLIHAALRELVAEMPAAERGDVEGVHRMRAAVRKLRSVLVLLAPHLDRKATRRFNAALRDIGAVLGHGRDWDVFLTETLVWTGEKQLGADTALLRPPAERQSERAHAVIRRTLRDHRLTRLILSLGVWTLERGSVRKAKIPFADLVPTLLDRLENKARKRWRDVATQDDDTLHDLRKSLKKLRYGAEYVSSLYAADAVDPYLHAIKGALTTLGDINDAAVTEQRIADIAISNATEFARASATLSRLIEVRRGKAIQKLSKKVAVLQDLEPFWSAR